ncbi:MAG TPA: hypothetical protein DIU11_00350, partial [Pusillimonas sp.]|nr:hypothetical protein [Pusillimonas sp.]
FSARFYSFESAQPLKEHEISAKIRSGRQFWLAVPKNRPSTILQALNQPEFSSKRYSLYLVNKHAQNALTAQATQSGLIEPISQ